MNPEILKKALEWTGPEYDEATRKEIQTLIDTGNQKELADRFWQDLEFGTGGLRGIIGAGSARINIYNIRKATQGLANYIVAQGKAAQGVVIGRDSRHFSLEFAREAACVLAANGIKVYFFRDICPTPVTAYALVQLGAAAGIMNTASHNPKEYNGYKVYWDDGAQLTPPHDQNVMDEIRKVTGLGAVKTMAFSALETSPSFAYCDEFFGRYLKEAESFPKDTALCAASDIKILYSPLHGAGYRCAPALLSQAGFKNIEVFQPQGTPDGDFPAAPYPNPEEIKAMQPGMDYAKAKGFDLFLATDPDADRIGAAYKKADGSLGLLNGNQIGVLIFDYLTRYPLPKKAFVVSTIVSTPLIGVIAAKKAIGYDEVLTGFKWVSAKMQANEKQGGVFLMGMEESHGYNICAKVRDKDGISAALMMAELSAFHKKAGLALDEVLLEIYKTYGYYKESQINLSFPGAEGAASIQAIMAKLRSNPPREVGGLKVAECRDYQNDSILKNGAKAKGPGLPSSNVFAMHMEGGARIIARPSGTEPKIKFYLCTVSEVHCENCVKAADIEHEELKEAFTALIK